MTSATDAGSRLSTEVISAIESGISSERSAKGTSRREPTVSARSASSLAPPATVVRTSLLSTPSPRATVTAFSFLIAARLTILVFLSTSSGLTSMSEAAFTNWVCVRPLETERSALERRTALAPTRVSTSWTAMEMAAAPATPIFDGASGFFASVDAASSFLPVALAYSAEALLDSLVTNVAAKALSGRVTSSNGRSAKRAAAVALPLRSMRPAWATTESLMDPEARTPMPLVAPRSKEWRATRVAMAPPAAPPGAVMSIARPAMASA